MEQDRERETGFAEVIVEIRDAKPEVTKVPADVTVFVCDHDAAEELESMGEAYALETVRGPLDRSTLGPGLLRERIEEKLADVEAAAEAIRSLVDGLTIEDAEELAIAVGSLTDARAEIRDTLDEIMPERPTGANGTPEGGEGP